MKRTHIWLNLIRFSLYNEESGKILSLSEVEELIEKGKIKLHCFPETTKGRGVIYVSITADKEDIEAINVEKDTNSTFYTR